MELNAFITSFHCFQEYSRKTVKIELTNCKLITIFKSDLSKTIWTGIGGVSHRPRGGGGILVLRLLRAWC
jgi:hypothetical protein